MTNPLTFTFQTSQFITHEFNIKRRVKHTEYQKHKLEEFYQKTPYPTKKQKAKLCRELDLEERNISIWFMHRRVKTRKGQLPSSVFQTPNTNATTLTRAKLDLDYSESTSTTPNQSLTMTLPKITLPHPSTIQLCSNYMRSDPFLYKLI